MARDAREGRRPAFGRIDPFCWAAAGPLLIVAVLFVFLKIIEGAIIAAVLAILLLLIDARVNRGTVKESTPKRGRTRQPARQPQRNQRNQRAQAQRTQAQRTQGGQRSRQQGRPPARRPATPPGRATR